MIEALGYRLTIRPDKPEDSELEKTKELVEAAGFVLPDKAKDDLESDLLREQAGVDQGIVLTIGSTAFNGDPWCQVGDYIAYARHAGKYIKDPDTGENVLVLNDEDVVARISKKDIKDE